MPTKKANTTTTDKENVTESTDNETQETQTSTEAQNTPEVTEAKFEVPKGVKDTFLAIPDLKKCYITEDGKQWFFNHTLAKNSKLFFTEITREDALK